MRHSIAVIAAFAFLVSAFPAPAEEHCVNVKKVADRPFSWCVDLDNYSIAIREVAPLVNEEVLNKAPSEAVPFLTYVAVATDERCYSVLVRPADGLTEVDVDVTVILKIGAETLEGTWVRNGVPSVPTFRLGPGSPKNRSGKSFMLLLAFPRLLADGWEWEDKDVSAITFSPSR